MIVQEFNVNADVASVYFNMFFFVAVHCSENSHYQICTETCNSPCPGLTDIINCPATCAEGCTCDDGYYYNGTGCVTLENCSCFFNGQTYKVSMTELVYYTTAGKEY